MQRDAHKPPLVYPPIEEGVAAKERWLFRACTGYATYIAVESRDFSFPALRSHAHVIVMMICAFVYAIPIP